MHCSGDVRGGESAWETGTPPGDAPVPAQGPCLPSQGMVPPALSFKYTVLCGAPVCLASPTPQRVCGQSGPLCGWRRWPAHLLGSSVLHGEDGAVLTPLACCWEHFGPAFW